jgi:serine/threonine protein phosphatase PrpC
VIGHFAANALTDGESPVYDKYYKNDFDEKDIFKIYGATFVLAAISERISFVLQTGDSPCLVFSGDGTCKVPPETINPDCEMGYTTSLSDSNAINNFRYYWAEEPPKAIFVCSDGVKDSYSEEDFYSFGTALLKEFEKDREAAMDFVRDWLPKLSERGSGDDMSIAGVYTVA